METISAAYARLLRQGAGYAEQSEKAVPIPPQRAREIADALEQLSETIPKNPQNRPNETETT
jgi:antitoxin component of MazEF toxin-antitoxin module